MKIEFSLSAVIYLVLGGFLACLLYVNVANGYNAFMVTENLNKTIDLNATLESLISQNKIISAKDYFGMMSSVYNNIFVTLICIISLSAILGFFYIKNQIKEQIDQAVKEYISNNERLKDIIEELFKEKFKKTFEEDIKNFGERVNQLEIQKESYESTLKKSIDSEATFKNNSNVLESQQEKD